MRVVERDYIEFLLGELPIGFIDGLEDLDPEMRIYEIRACLSCSLGEAFKVNKLLVI